MGEWYEWLKIEMVPYAQLRRTVYSSTLSEQTAKVQVTNFIKLINKKRQEIFDNVYSRQVS